MPRVPTTTPERLAELVRKNTRTAARLAIGLPDLAEQKLQDLNANDLEAKEFGRYLDVDGDGDQYRLIVDRSRCHGLDSRKGANLGQWFADRVLSPHFLCHRLHPFSR